MFKLPTLEQLKEKSIAEIIDYFLQPIEDKAEKNQRAQLFKAIFMPTEVSVVSILFERNYQKELAKQTELFIKFLLNCDSSLWEALEECELLVSDIPSADRPLIAAVAEIGSQKIPTRMYKEKIMAIADSSTLNAIFSSKKITKNLIMSEDWLALLKCQADPDILGQAFLDFLTNKINPEEYPAVIKKMGEAVFIKLQSVLSKNPALVAAYYLAFPKSLALSKLTLFPPRPSEPTIRPRHHIKGIKYLETFNIGLMGNFGVGRFSLMRSYFLRAFSQGVVIQKDKNLPDSKQSRSKFMNQDNIYVGDKEISLSINMQNQASRSSQVTATSFRDITPNSSRAGAFIVLLDPRGDESFDSIYHQYEKEIDSHGTSFLWQGEKEHEAPIFVIFTNADITLSAKQQQLHDQAKKQAIALAKVKDNRCIFLGDVSAKNFNQVEKIIHRVIAETLSSHWGKYDYKEGCPQVRPEDITKRYDLLYDMAHDWQDSAEQTAENIFKSVELLLQIPPHGYRFLDARFEAFECAYANYRLMSLSTCSAFVEAFPCCLHTSGKLIAFERERNIKLNIYLMSAAGLGKDVHANAESLESSLINKLNLMKYVIAAYLKTPNLPKLSDWLDIAKLNTPAFQQAWESVKASIFSSNQENLRLMIAAIDEASPIKPTTLVHSAPRVDEPKPIVEERPPQIKIIDLEDPDIDEASNYYDLLGVDKDANNQEIERAYRFRALRWHPDKHHGEDEKRKFTIVLQLLSRAKETLIDERQRAEYDREHQGAKFKIK